MLDEIASENEIPFEIIVQDTTIKYQYGMFPGKFTVPFEGSCGHELQKLENRVGVNPSVLKHSVSLNKLEPQIILEVAFSDVASCSHNGSIIVYAQVIAKDKMSYDIVGKSNTLYLMETSDGGLKVLHRHVVSVR